MSINKKIIFTMISLTVVVVAAILLSNIVQFSNYVDTEITGALRKASSLALKEIDMLKSQAAIASAYVAGDSEIVDAMEKGNQEALMNRSALLYADTGVGFCTIADASGIVLSRPHSPESLGDDVTAMPSVKSALSGRALTTIEPGSSVRMSICSGSPVYNSQGGLLGVVVVGFRLDTNEMVDSIKELSGNEATIFLGDERVSTTLLKEDGTRAVGTKAAANVTKAVFAGRTYEGQTEVLDRDALVMYTPIKGYDGKTLGMLFVGHFLNEKENTILSFVEIGLLITLILIAASILVILFMVGHIVSPIRDMVKAARALAAGDTKVRVESKTKDETRELANAFNEMIENTRQQVEIIEAIADGDLSVAVSARSDKDVMNRALGVMLDLNNETFALIVDSAHQVSSGAQQMASSAQVLAQGATEQSATMQQLSAAISEVEVKTKDSAAMAGKAATLSETIMDNAQKGSGQMKRMVQAVKEINEASFSINKIIKVIDDIAFQTNILALNAAVEAARAGMHGKGFAVVADEVRNLAAKSAEAAKDTSNLIENSIAKAELGVHIADQTAASLDEIVSGIDESCQIVEEIVKYSEAQSTAIALINDGIGHVAQVVHQNSANAEEGAAASEEMSGQAELLLAMVSRFRLKNDSDMIAQSNRAYLPQAASNTPLALSYGKQAV